LSEEVRRGTFREDLFYRLHVMHIEIPPLRDRREDIPLLLEHFIARFDALQAKNITGASRDVLTVLMEHDYPGNIRELQNIVEHAFVLCQGGEIRIQHLPPYLRQRAIPSVNGAGRELDLRTMERALVVEALRRYGGSRSRAARALGIDPSTLYRKLKAIDIELPQGDGRAKRGEKSRVR
jgi:DNA-binding NtrC family response regulator